MHSMVWLWTTGRHHTAWLQGAGSIFLVVITFIAYDTHTLAKTSLEQIKLAKKERDAVTMRNYNIAYDCFCKVQHDLISVMQTLVDGTFGSKPQAALYPENWPDVTEALSDRIPETALPAIRLGTELRVVDFAVSEFFSAYRDDKRACESIVIEHVKQGVEQCNALRQAMERSSPNS